jgi:hypothetical protein
VPKDSITDSKSYMGKRLESQNDEAIGEMEQFDLNRIIQRENIKQRPKSSHLGQMRHSSAKSRGYSASYQRPTTAKGILKKKGGLDSVYTSS